jgi:hypothetical protein
MCHIAKDYDPALWRIAEEHEFETIFENPMDQGGPCVYCFGNKNGGRNFRDTASLSSLYIVDPFTVIHAVCRRITGPFTTWVLFCID